MKGCVQWNPVYTVYSWKEFRHQLDLNRGLLEQQASTLPTGLTIVIKNQLVTLTNRYDGLFFSLRTDHRLFDGLNSPRKSQTLFLTI